MEKTLFKPVEGDSLDLQTLKALLRSLKVWEIIIKVVSVLLILGLVWGVVIYLIQAYEELESFIEPNYLKFFGYLALFCVCLGGITGISNILEAKFIKEDANLQFNFDGNVDEIVRLIVLSSPWTHNRIFKKLPNVYQKYINEINLFKNMKDFGGMCFPLEGNVHIALDLAEQRVKFLDTFSKYCPYVWELSKKEVYMRIICALPVLDYVLLRKNHYFDKCDLNSIILEDQFLKLSEDQIFIMMLQEHFPVSFFKDYDITE